MAALVLALALCPASPAQDASTANPLKNQAPFDPRDLSGQWSGGLGGGLHPVGKPPAMTPEAQAKFAANTA